MKRPARKAFDPRSEGSTTRHRHSPLAITVYTANLIMVTALDAAAWFYATARPQPTEKMSPRVIEVSRVMSAVPVAGFIVAAGLAWLSTWAALVLVALLPLLPISGASYRLQYRLGNET